MRKSSIPTVREIKMAICAHEKLRLAGSPEQHVPGGVWQTKLTCPSCGAWEIRETADITNAPATIPPAEGEVATAELVWDDCTVELRCQERGARIYPLCRYDAIALGPAGRSVSARSPMFDNGITQAERTAILEAVGRDLVVDGWEPAPPTTDPMPRFRRRVSAAVSSAMRT